MAQGTRNGSPSSTGPDLKDVATMLSSMRTRGRGEVFFTVSEAPESRTGIQLTACYVVPVTTDGAGETIYAEAARVTHVLSPYGYASPAAALFSMLWGLATATAEKLDITDGLL